MSDERMRIPCDSKYISALGLTTFAFARCEWQVVWCAEKIRPGSVDKIVREEMTAGSIGKYFTNVVRNMPRSSARDELSELATQFLALVEVRNGIIHGKPCTSPEGQQRLAGQRVIEIVDLAAAADAFAALGTKLNSLFYGFLQTYVPPQIQSGAQAAG